MGKTSLKLKFFQILGALIISFGGILGSARAEIPAAGFTFKKGSLELRGNFLSLEGSEDAIEFSQGFASELNKIRDQNANVKVFIHWVDAVRNSLDRGLASADGAEDFAQEIASQNPGAEIDGHRITIPELKEPSEGLSPSQLKYVRNADRFAFILRVGVIGSVECVHLFLSYHVPVWIPIGAGLATVSAMLFNVVNTEKITNAVNYMKWKSLSDEEMAEINQRIAGMSRFQKMIQVPRIYFFSFLYEIAFQGSLQTVIHGLFYAGGGSLPFMADKFFGSIVAGSVGETAFDLAQGAYQETRAGKVPRAIRSANMKIISAVGSILSVDGILLSSNAAEAGYWSLGSMIATGLTLAAYFRYTEEIHATVLPRIASSRQRVSSFVSGVGEHLEQSRRGFCNFLLKALPRKPGKE
jgi:hypothetical protein